MTRFLARDKKAAKASVAEKKKPLVPISFYAIFSVFICLGLIEVIFLGKQPYEISLNEGDIALRDIYAPFTFIYGVHVDEALTRQAQFAAMDDVPEVFDHVASARGDLQKELDMYFDAFSAGRASNTAAADKVASAASLDQDLKIFTTIKNLDQIHEKMKLFMSEIIGLNVLDRMTHKELIDRNVEYVVIRDIVRQSEEEVFLHDILTIDTMGPVLDELSYKFFPEGRRVRLGAGALIKKIVRPTIVYNPTETARRKKQARDDAPSIQRYLEMKKGEVIIQRGQRVGREVVDQLTVLNEKRHTINQAALIAGIALPVMLIILLFGMYLYLFESVVFNDRKQISVIGLLILVGVLLTRVVTLSPVPSTCIPLAIPIMLITLLVGPRVAIIAALILGGLNSLLIGEKFAITMIGLTGGLVAVYSVRGARRRSQVLRGGVLVGLANFIVIAGIGLINNLEFNAWVIEGALGIASGLISAVFVLGILPIFEHIFQITTNISLLELADLNHPLLRTMMMNAPGTYHHSIVVGNLAEAACDGIGANSLLARVASYFHDIGKIEKAEYFVENQSDAASRHDKLMPTMSNLIIMNHVKNGVELAKKYTLPRSIMDFIAQHHGTSLVFYFYHRALERSEGGDTSITEEEFRYPGPKPQTKETAVVLLADSVEAATRAATDTSHARLKGLVRKVINNKFIDGQLDECELTLRDLDRIANAFLKVLSGIYHARIEYPEPNNVKEAPEKNGNSSKKQPGKNQGAKKRISAQGNGGPETPA